MFKNKSGIFALALAMAAICFTGCGAEGNSLESSNSVDLKTEDKTFENNDKKDAESDLESDSESFSVVCTIFPEY
ncbi:MAG: hypothetical protein IKH50_09115, partial [Oscillospiraceae bacterium]|nr:hypothetical protein [Oscillospiraceae bacterium]